MVIHRPPVMVYGPPVVYERRVYYGPTYYTLPYHSREPSVSLCYARPRRPPLWPYNLFSMVHGRERRETLREVHAILMRTGLEAVPRAVLFSTRRFIQRAARYAPIEAGAAETPA
jgi:hypothetical protein